MESKFPLHDLKFNLMFNDHYYNHFSSSFVTFQNENQLLKIHLSMSCKSLNNSQWFGLHHISF